MKRYTTWIVLLGICLLVTACSKVKQYDKGNIRVCSWRDKGFISLLIGTPSRPYKGIPPLLLKMSDGSVINTGETNVQTLTSKCAGRSDASGAWFTDIGTPAMALNEKWPDGAIQLQDQARVFVVQSNVLISFCAGWNPHGDDFPPPQIGNPRTGKWYTFPLQEEDLIELFGEPEIIREYLSE